MKGIGSKGGGTFFFFFFSIVKCSPSEALEDERKIGG